MPTVLQVLDLVPEYKRLKPAGRNSACCEVERILNKFSFKLRLSPYKPTHERDYIPNLNTDVIEGTKVWLASFPEEYRLGALVALLSTVYITQPEFEQLCENAVSTLSTYLFEMEGRPSQWRWPVPRTVARRILPFPLDAFAAYELVIRRLGIEGTIDASGTGARATLASSLSELIPIMFEIADRGEERVSYRHLLDKVKDRALGWIDRYLLIVADWSLSGSSLGSDLVRLLRVTRVLFGPHTDCLDRKRHKPPQVAVLVPFITSEALEELRRKLRSEGALATVPIAAGVVEEGLALRRNLPPTVRSLKDVFATIRCQLHGCVERTLDYYFQQYGAACWANYRQRHDVTDDWKWGFKGGGYAVVSYLNAPNNSLPVLWHAPPDREVGSPFPRQESRASHASDMERMDWELQKCEEDPKKSLHTFLRGCYEADL